MKRRDLLKASLGITLVPTVALADEISPDLRLTRAVGFDLVCHRAKYVGKNSRLDDHGDRATERMVRLYTNAGVEGIGVCRAPEPSLAAVLGRPLRELVNLDKRCASEHFGHGTMPVWDLVGNVLKRPVHELLGNEGPKQVPVYDGSLYFSDLLPDYAHRWPSRFREELDEGLARGHRAFKLKIGRGAKWMPRQEGDARDIEVIRLVRSHVGPDVLIGVDANNGYDLLGAKRLLEAVEDVRLTFVEELFHEDVASCRDLKQFIADRGWKTLVADGETQTDLAPLVPLIQQQALDILQADMNRFGIEGILEESRLAAPQGIQIAPHNWGSLMGHFQQLHIARAIPNFYLAEHDPLSTTVLRAEGYTIGQGLANLPDAAGFGLTVDESAFTNEVSVRFDLRA